MAGGMTITTQLNTLQTVFNKIKEVHFKKGELKTSDLATTLTVDMELPVLEDGISFNTGDADITETKLTTGEKWVTRAMKGDADISLQVASIAGKINALFMEEKKASITSGVGAVIDGITYKGTAYSLAPKKVTGSLIFPCEDRQTVIILPKMEMYASLVVADGENPAYFNVKVTPVKNSEGFDLLLLEKTA